MNDDVTITVSRVSLREVLEDATRFHAPGFECRHIVAVRAAIPEPEWEPTDEQMMAYSRSQPGWAKTRAEARGDLKALHREGLVP